MSTHEEDIANLPKEAAPARDLWPGIEARTRRTAPSRPKTSSLLHWAAALLLFVSGVAVGQVWGRSSAASAPPASIHPLAAAEEVQRTGTEYVAAVAALRGEARSEVRTQGREAAFSTLFGAAHELSRLSPEDPAARQILTTASRARHLEERP